MSKQTAEEILAEMEKNLDVYAEIPDHDHSHSLYVRCLDCQVFGINLPTLFTEVSACGNCGSLNTVKYYPACCIFSDRRRSSAPALIRALRVAMAERDEAISIANLNPAIKSLRANNKNIAKALRGEAATPFKNDPKHRA
jgi:ribosomal protein S27E